MRVENRSKNKIRNIRLCAMGILAFILLCMMYTVGLATGRATVTFPEQPGVRSELITTPPSNLPAWCLFQPGTTWKIQGSPVSNLVYNWLYVALALLILIYSYVTRALLLYFDSLGQVVFPVVKLLRLDKLADFGKRYGFPEIKSIERRLEGMGRSWVSYRILRSLYTLFLALKQSFSSTLWEVRNIQQPSAHYANSYSSDGCHLLLLGAQFVFLPSVKAVVFNRRMRRIFGDSAKFLPYYF